MRSVFMSELSRLPSNKKAIPAHWRIGTICLRTSGERNHRPYFMLRRSGQGKHNSSP